MLILSLLLTVIATTETILPRELTWLSVLSIPDLARCCFKLNLKACFMSMKEPFEYVRKTGAMIALQANSNLRLHPSRSPTL